MALKVEGQGPVHPSKKSPPGATREGGKVTENKE